MPGNQEFKYEIPEKRTHSTKIMPCRGCGFPMKVGVRTRNAPRCLECGIKAQITAVTEMREKSGPTYDRWVQGMSQAAQRQGWVTPPPSTDGGS